MEYASFSRLSKYSCPARGFFSYERGLRPKGPTFVAMHAGSCGHIALDTFWRTGDLDAALEALENAWGERPTPLLGADEPITVDMMLEAVESYVDSFHKGAYEPVLLPELDSVPGVRFVEGEQEGEQLSEVMLEVDFDGLSVPYRGILDRMMRHKRTGQLEVWDTKFTMATLYPHSRWSPDVADRHIMSMQLPSYALMWRKATGFDIAAGKIELIYMGSSPKFELGQTRLVSVFDSWDDDMEERFVEWAEARVQEVLWRRQTGYWPQLEGSYERQHVCSKCDFKSLCEATPAKRPAFIAMQYDAL